MAPDNDILAGFAAYSSQSQPSVQMDFGMDTEDVLSGFAQYEQMRGARQTILPRFTEKLEEGRLLTGEPDIEPPRRVGAAERFSEPVLDMPQDAKQEQPILSNPYMYGGLKEPVPTRSRQQGEYGLIEETGRQLGAGTADVMGGVGMGLQVGGRVLEGLGKPTLDYETGQEVGGIPVVGAIVRRTGEYLRGVGKETSDFWSGQSDKLPQSTDISKDIVSNPELLANPKWWASNVARMTPGMAASVMVGIATGGIANLGRVPSATYVLQNGVWRNYATRGGIGAIGAVAGGTTGGLIEGQQTYQDALKNGATEEEAIDAGAKMTMASGLLNAISLDAMLNKQAMSNLAKFLVTGTTEALTEYAEEPAEGVILGEDWETFKQRLISGVSVMPPSFLMGGIGGVGAKNSGIARKPVSEDVKSKAIFGAPTRTGVESGPTLFTGVDGKQYEVATYQKPDGRVRHRVTEITGAGSGIVRLYDATPEQINEFYGQKTSRAEQPIVDKNAPTPESDFQRAGAVRETPIQPEQPVAPEPQQPVQPSVIDTAREGIIDSDVSIDTATKRISFRDQQPTPADRQNADKLFSLNFPVELISKISRTERQNIADNNVNANDYLDAHPYFLNDPDIAMAVNDELVTKTEQEIEQAELERKEAERMAKEEQKPQPPQVEQIIQPKETIERKPYERIRHDAKGNAILHPRALAEDDIRALPYFDNLGVVGRGGYVIEPSLTSGRFNLIHKTLAGNIVKVPGQQNVTKASAEKFIQDNGGNVYVGEIYDKLGSVRVGTGAASRPLLDTNKFFDTSEDEFADNYAQAMRDNYGEAFGEGTAHRYTLSSIANEAEDELGRIYSGDTGQTADERNTYQGMTKDEYDAAVEWYNSITREFPDITADELNAIRRGEFTADDLRRARSIFETEADTEIREMAGEEEYGDWLDAEVERLMAEEQATTQEDVERFTRGEQVEGIISREPEVGGEQQQVPAQSYKISRANPGVKRIIADCFPDFKGRNITITNAQPPTSLDSYWDEGHRDYFVFYEPATGKKYDVHSNHPAFERNQTRTLKNGLPQGVVLVQRTYFGSSESMRIYAPGADLSTIDNGYIKGESPSYSRSGYNDAWSRTTAMIEMNDSLTGKPIPIGSSIYVNDMDARILSPESHSALMQNPQRQAQYEAEYEQGGKERAQEARKQFKRLNIDPNQLNMFDASEQMKMTFMAEKGYNNKESGGGVTDEDVRKLFHYADDFGITSDGGMYATIKNRVFKIYNVKFINPDTAAFMAEYGREFDPKQDKIVGASLNSVLFITREGDRWTMAHEFYHELEKMGVVTEADVKTIKRTVASLRGKKLSEVTPYEEAAFVHEGLRRRAYQRDTMVGRVLQKIQDFIDGLVNIFRKTGEGVIRNIESGQIFERDANVARAAVNYMAAEEQWKQDESNIGQYFNEFEKYLDEDSKSRIKEWIFASAITPLSTRIRKYSLPVYSRLMNFEHNERKAIMKDNSAIIPFVVKYREMTDADKAEFEFAAFNEDQYKLDEFLTKYNMNNEYNAFRKVMDGIYDRLVAAGYKVAYRDFYFPRMVKDLRGYLDYLYGTQEKDAILEAIKQEEKSKGKPLTPEEQFAIANNVIRGYAGKVTLAGPGNIKARTVPFVNENNRQFYHDMTEAIFRYIVRANRAIETKNFFGKHLKVGRLYANAIEAGVSDNPVPTGVIEDSIGAMLLEHDMRPESRNKLKDLLQARFNFAASPEWIQKFKMLGYITAMGTGFNSAISQVADVGISTYMGGINAAPEFGKAVFRNLVDDVYVRYNPYYQKNPDKIQALHDKIDNVINLYGAREFTLEGLGIESMGSEFRGAESFNKWLEKVFNMTFIHTFDVAGKETLVNSTYKRMVKEAQTGNWKRNHAKILFDAFAGDREKINQVTQDLADGKKTEDIDFLMNVVLSNFQPIWLSETTEGYLRNPKARAFYTLKTFLLKQIDAIRRQSLDDIVRGIKYGKEGKIGEGAKLTGQGLASMIHLGGFMILAGAGTDAIKDWILDRDIDLRDLVIDNMLRFIGLNRYVLVKSREEGLAVSAYRVIAPPINWVEDIGRDAWSGIGNYFEWRDAVAEGKTPQRFQPSKMYTWGDMPLGGQWYEYRGIPFTNLSGRGKDYQYVKRTTAAKEMAKERKLASDADHKRFMDNMIKMIDGGYINKRDAVESTRQFIETQNTMRGLALKPPIPKETVNQWSNDITDAFKKSLDEYEKRDVKLIYEMDDMNKLVRQAAELVNDQQMFDSEAIDYIRKMIASQNRLRDNYLKPKITEEQANKLSTLYVKVRKEQK